MDVTRGPGTLLHQAGVEIVGRWFVVDNRRYDLTKLSRLRTVRGPQDPLTTHAVVVSGLVLALTGVLLIVSSGHEPVRFGALLAIGAAVLVPLALAWAGARVRPRPYALWAEYQGMTVQLFCTTSERQYGQVCRALIRAREIAIHGPAARSWANVDPLLGGGFRR